MYHTHCDAPYLPIKSPSLIVLSITFMAKLPMVSLTFLLKLPHLLYYLLPSLQMYHTHSDAPYLPIKSSPLIIVSFNFMENYLTYCAISSYQIYSVSVVSTSDLSNKITSVQLLYISYLPVKITSVPIFK